MKDRQLVDLKIPIIKEFKKKKKKRVQSEPAASRGGEGGDGTLSDIWSTSIIGGKKKKNKVSPGVLVDLLL